MKKIVVGLAVTFILCIVGVARATPFLDVVDFSSNGNYIGQSFSEISDSNSANSFEEYTHIVDFSPYAISVDSASLTINYAYVTNKILGGGVNKEFFLFSESSGPSPIGELTGFDDDLWHSMTFDLSDYVAAISGPNWSIGFNFKESTLGKDTFYLDKSTLFGEYTAETNGDAGNDTFVVVPEPSAFLLLGGGLLSLVFVARRRKKE